MDTRLAGTYRVGDVSLFRPKLEVGQWWANREPATLLQVMSVSDAGTFEQVCFRQWVANAPAEPPNVLHWMLPVKQLEYLYFEMWINIPSQDFYEKEWQFGEIRIVPHEERLFFVAEKKRTEDGFFARARSSWQVGQSQALNSSLYAAGSIPSPTGRTVYDLLMTPDEEVTHSEICEKALHQSPQEPEEDGAVLLGPE